MRDVVFAINATANGTCSHTDGIADAELHRYFTDVVRGADVMLYGRVTYQLMVPFWPDLVRTPSGQANLDDFARAFDAVEKVLFSRTVDAVADPRTRLAEGSLVDEVRALRQRPGKNILVGSLSLAAQLTAHGLIDEYQLVVHPVLSSGGPRLLAEGATPSLRLDRVGTTSFESGALAIRYRTRREPAP